ncbi:MAG: hypothetical protein JJD93_12700 [Ilumatobacteraceae bacterium]|nr:hypothetical protein [Ilumatobacteraceae bacterium]
MRTLTPDDMTWNTTLLSPTNAVADIAALRSQDGGDILIWGSSSEVTETIAVGVGEAAHIELVDDRVAPPFTVQFGPPRSLQAPRALRGP